MDQTLTATQPIPPHVMTVLTDGRTDGNRYFLPARTLDRKLYEDVDKVLVALGGKWNRSAKAHVFTDASRLETALTTGTFADPKTLSFFATPPQVVKRLVGIAGVERGHRCLEPSSGEGAIVRELAAVTGSDNVVAIEADPHRSASTREQVATLTGDFLSCDPETFAPFDRVVMNPPFTTPGHPRADIEHVRHAMRFLRPGGVLAAVMSSGVQFRDDRMAREFRDWLDAHDGRIISVPDEAFRESGTLVRTVIVRAEAR